MTTTAASAARLLKQIESQMIELRNNVQMLNETSAEERDDQMVRSLIEVSNGLHKAIKYSQ